MLIKFCLEYSYFELNLNMFLKFVNSLNISVLTILCIKLSKHF